MKTWAVLFFLRVLCYSFDVDSLSLLLVKPYPGKEIETTQKRMDNDINYPKHIVATASLILNKEREVLLVKSEKRGWEMPGGQVEEGEDVPFALKREIMEEAGVSINILKLSAVYSSIDEPCKVILDFVSEYTGGVPKKR